MRIEATKKSEGRIAKIKRPSEKEWYKYQKGGYPLQNIETSISRYKIDSEKDCWFKDINKIVNSLSFRRLQYKTQVFLKPTGDHFSDRMRHTLAVDQISSRIARHRLNVDLTRAIALAHDLGHTPYGHAGERALDDLIQKYSNKKLSFSHVPQGARVLLYIEYDSRFSQPINDREGEEYGIEPTIEVIKGILKHSETYIEAVKHNKNVDKIPALEKLISNPTDRSNPESDCVRIADKISQCIHDLADAYKLKLIDEDDLKKIYPTGITSRYGEELETCLIENVEINEENGLDLNGVGKETIDCYKEIMGEKVYGSEDVIISDNRARHILEDLFKYYMSEWKVIEKIEAKGIQQEIYRKIDRKKGINHKVPRNIYENRWLHGLEWPRIVTNFLACMTDRYADDLHHKLFH